MKNPKPKPTSVDEYLDLVESPEMKEALSRLRTIVREELPEAEEGISYGIPCYKQNGYVASFAAFKSHCSFFPGHTVDAFKDQLTEFKLLKGTNQFKPSRPIPENLVREILRTRASENSS